MPRLSIFLVSAVVVAVLTPSPGLAQQTGSLFAERAAALGVDFVYFNGRSGEYYFPEINGAGLALLDYDDDTDLDIFFIQGTLLGPDKKLEQALVPPKHPPPFRHRLYRNDLEVKPDGTRVLRFTDVSGQAGLLARGYGQAVTTGDYDNDGCVDLYVAGFGHNQIFRNNCDGTFTEVTGKAGVDDGRWSSAATFFDYDRDGSLDLFVGNYVDFSFSNHKTCLRVTGAQDYCGPQSYDPVPDRLFHNNGDGTFTDVTPRSGLLNTFGPALGVVSADLDADGWPDLYVANDQKPNQMWINQQDGTFEDQALMMGAAVNGQGVSEASMGVVAEDFDSDGDLDLLMTHLLGETNTYFRNEGKDLFTDLSIPTRLGPPSQWATGFGVVPLDYDNDGRLDVMSVNGEVRVIEELARQGDPYPLHQPNQLFRNLGGGRFEELTERAGDAFSLSEVSRGAAVGDLDNDGDPDVVITNNDGPARILINEVGHERPWLGLRLVGADGKRDMLGARVELHRQGQPAVVRWVHTDGSYASGNDPRVLFGLGDAPKVARVRVVWPDGQTEDWTKVTLGQYTSLRQGTGTPVRRSTPTDADDTPPEN